MCSVFMLKYTIFAALVLLVPLMYWQFILYVFIFANGFDINYLRSGIVALVYMLIQHNLGEIVAHYVVKV